MAGLNFHRFNVDVFYRARDVAKRVGQMLFRRSGGVDNVTFVIGAEAANVINVGLQCVDENGDDCAVRTGLMITLFADADGDSINAQDYTTIAVGTDGWLTELIADKHIIAGTEADGDLDIDITLSSGAATSFLGVLLPGGKWIISGAITHAA